MICEEGKLILIPVIKAYAAEMKVKDDTEIVPYFRDVKLSDVEDINKLRENGQLFDSIDNIKYEINENWFIMDGKTLCTTRSVWALHLERYVDMIVKLYDIQIVPDDSKVVVTRYRNDDIDAMPEEEKDFLNEIMDGSNEKTFENIGSLEYCLNSDYVFGQDNNICYINENDKMIEVLKFEFENK